MVLAKVDHAPSRWENGAGHISVMAAEAAELLVTDLCGVYVDATCGPGGHALEIGTRLRIPPARIVAVDRDAEALEVARGRLSRFGDGVTLVHDDFRNIFDRGEELGLRGVTGVVADLGVSSLQLDSDERGFSFRRDGPLDMRMDRRDSTTAAHLVQRLSEKELADIIYLYGEERRSRAIAKRIVESRQGKGLTRTGELASLIEDVCGRRPGGRTHPATRTFQALRIAVNRELEGLEEFLRQAVGSLLPGGRLAVISFHSLEDRIVKWVFRELEGRCVCENVLDDCICPRVRVVRSLFRGVLTPSDAEAEGNPRSRSARMRVVEKSYGGDVHDELCV